MSSIFFLFCQTWIPVSFNYHWQEFRPTFIKVIYRLILRAVSWIFMQYYLSYGRTIMTAVKSINARTESLMRISGKERKNDLTLGEIILQKKSKYTFYSFWWTRTTFCYNHSRPTEMTLQDCHKARNQQNYVITYVCCSRHVIIFRESSRLFLPNLVLLYSKQVQCSSQLHRQRDTGKRENTAGVLENT